MRQSPIDITEDVCQILSSRSVQPLKYSNYWDCNGSATILNDGHTVRILFDMEGSNPTLSGGNLPAEYKLMSIHFHWGPHDNAGSEHRISGKSFSMEAHCVHLKTDYSHIDEEALSHEDALVVVSFFIQVICSKEYEHCNKDNELLNPLVNVLGSITEQGSSATMSATDVLRIFQERATPTGYFTYPGSLTTPAYNEVVTWIVYPSLILISHNQVEAFRQIKNSEGRSLSGNSREIQPIGERTVVYYEK